MNQSKSESAIRRIAIAGHGVEAWLAANHLLAALAPRNVQISIHPVDGSDDWDALYCAWPAGPDDGLASIGLGGHSLAAQCRGSFSLGVRYKEQFRPYGGVGIDFSGVPFHHHWQHHQGGQGADSYFSWSVAHTAAGKEAFAPPQPRNAIGPLQHATARHLDISLLTAVLRQRAMQHGVSVVDQPIEAVDLAIDCSGPQRALTSGRSWRAAEGICTFRAEFATGNTTGSPPPWHSVQPTSDGWVLEIPGHGWKNTVRLVAGESGGGTRFAPGHVSHAWEGNTLALGLAAAVLLPAEPLQARFLASSIRNMINLLPGKDCAAREVIEYNHLQQTDLAEVEDLLSAHEYARTDRLETGSVHGSLALRLKQFIHRGWITPADSEFPGPADWAGTWILLGIRPEKTSRLVKRMPAAELQSRMDRLQEEINRAASEFPSHRDFLRAVQSAASTSQKRPG